MTSSQNTSASVSIIKELASSKYPIYLATSPSTGQHIAIKSFPIDNVFYRKEKEILMSLNHPHIIRLCEAVDNAAIIRDKRCSYLGLEYAPYGDLMELIVNHGKIPEILTRTLFHQLIDALSYMHEQNIAHLDLKVDNLLVDENFNLRVTDFDLSQKLDSEKINSNGTPGYRAPEIKYGSCENLRAADIYSAAIVLFVMISGNPPYGEVNKGFQVEYDGFYRVMRKQNSRFWEVHAKHRGDPEFYSPEFKELFGRMVEEDPTKRATIEEIKESKWFQGPIWDEDTCKLEIRKYMKVC